MEVLFYETHDVYTHGLPQALERLGHHVTVWQGAPSIERLERYLASAQPELILSMGWMQMHRDRASLEAIRQYCLSPRALHVFWSTEDPIHTSVWTLEYLEKARPDAVLTISPTTVPLLRRLGYAAEEMPFAADPEVHRPTPGATAVDVVLVGTAYGEMSGLLRGIGLGWLLRPLLGLPARVEVHGSFWGGAQRSLGFELPASWLRPAVAYRDIARLYTSAAVVLCPQNEPNQLTGRTFEALGTGGGVLLTLRTPGVQRHFQEGRHLLCTSSADETADLLRRYLPDLTARRQISAAGRAEVLARHTYDQRAEELLTLVGRWLLEKRRAGRVSPLDHCRLQAIRPEEIKTMGQEGESLRLRFAVPVRPQGLPLVSAHLYCFAQEVLRVGDALCLLQPTGTVLDVRHVTQIGSRPYPYDAGWQQWDVTEALRSPPGPFLDFELQAVQGLSVRWEQPGTRSLSWLIQFNQQAFAPRLVLRWGEGTADGYAGGRRP